MEEGGEDLSQNPVIYSLADIEEYKETKEVTKFVKLNVSYSDDKGQRYNGDIIVELSPEDAPITVENFQSLVSEGFYDGLIFHRIIEGFMIQGGGFDAEMKEKDADSITGEFSSNGVENNLLHERGVISMARTNVPDSASSQFFIVHETSPHLDGKYAAFGRVISGMSLVDGIAAMATDDSDVPLKSAYITKASFVEYTPADESGEDTTTSWESVSE
ncbi:MAG: peptidylprolyl isomerase [Clostridia bacterium]|nr:peptidylprolyl isomerase [Clostridia bacterium]